MTAPIDVWERARRGQHTVVLGLTLATPPQDMRVVRVSCDVPASTLGPLLDARNRIERILGSHTPLVEAARARVMTGLRRHLLGDLPSVASEGSLVEVCNRLAALGPAALVLEAADAADSASLDMLRHILGRPGWLRLPIVIVMRADPLPPAASALVDAMRAAAGDDAVYSMNSQAGAAAAPAGGAGEASRAGEAGARSARPREPFEPRALPADVLRVLRALAIAGSGTEAAVLAELLETGELAILDALQRAADLGAPVDDRGEGRFHLPDDAAQALRATVLPSLAAALHRRVAAILGQGRAPAEEAEAEAPHTAVPFEASSDETPRPGDAWEVMQADEAAVRAAEELEVQRAAAEAATRAAEEAAARAAEEAAAHAAEEAARAAEARAKSEADARREAAEAAEHAVERAQRELSEEASAVREEAPPKAAESSDEAPRPPSEQARSTEEARPRDEARPSEEPRATVYYKPFTGDTRPAPETMRAEWLSPLASEPRTSRKPGAPRVQRAPDGPRVLRADDARAARHLVAAGEAEAAIERYFEAMQKAAAAAAYPQAVAHAQAALAVLDRLPPTEGRRLRRVQLLLAAGRVLWQGAGPDDSFTLPGALRVLESARDAAQPSDPADLRADLAATIAGVLYEIGDIQSLARALEELSSASRALAEAGEPQAAARFFNDQASVYIRLGDPVRAAHLLTESRKIFEPTAKTDPIAMVEMAETDHLFARILLHVPARPGREDDALSLGLDHGIAAERSFRRLGAPREVGRVLETMGRIELRKGRHERAASHLTSAVKLQESVGDVIGLARSTAALSDVLAATGKVREALNLLGDSIVLNFEKGSPLGVAFNRRALQSFDRTAVLRAGAADLFEEASMRLAAAEKALGRIPIPGTAAEVG